MWFCRSGWLRSTLEVTSAICQNARSAMPDTDTAHAVRHSRYHPLDPNVRATDAVFGMLRSRSDKALEFAFR